MRRRLALVGFATIVLLGGAVAYGASAFESYQRGLNAPSAVTTTSGTGALGPAHIVFRNTAIGQGYGLVADVPLASPGGPRRLSEVACDRVYATREYTMCLRINQGMLTTFSADLLDANADVVHTWPLPGVPSRTRISPDSNLVAFSAFVTGESYATVGFSIATHIATVGGADSGNLERFALTVDGAAVTSADLNVWGVTFTDDDNLFYATAASNGRTWLVLGDRSARTLTAVREGAECPSLSPDGSQIAYKKKVTSSGSPRWGIAVLDLAVNRETIIPEMRNVDDQIEWLDDETLLYGLLRDDAAGSTDVWAVASDGSGTPEMLIEHAWSPAVIRD